MAKINYIFISVCVFILFSSFNLESTCLKQTIDSQIGIKELTGNNDGKEIEKYQKATNSPKYSSYCASFVKWCFLQCGKNPSISAWSPTAHNPKNIVYFNGRFEKEPVLGDVFTVYSLSKKRIVHTGFYYSYYNNRVFLTAEANTSSNGVITGSFLDVNGNGNYKKLRSYHAVYGITRF